MEISCILIFKWELQIFHCKERDLWITATTIGCKVGALKLYDSLYTTLDEPSRIA